ncbi:MAG: site-specific DNA-methyltransferase, partial [Acidimicrobiia bacterium]|nr:site-specific DNA-methyltransferase [Acidimicrobiia bacterium]
PFLLPPILSSVLMPVDVEQEALRNLRLAALDTSYVSLGGRRTASVHEFYRYPARFSPGFARAAIQTFTKPRDLVIDPFSGGGTSVVEAQLLGRYAIAADTNPLATFITTAKTTLYSENTLDQLRELSDTVHNLPVKASGSLQNKWAQDGYWRNISTQQTWRIRNLLLNGIDAVRGLPTHDAQILGRCALLRTGQWAFDMRDVVPTVNQFRTQLSKDIKAMVLAASHHYSSVVDEWEGQMTRPKIINSGLPDSAQHPAMTSSGPPDLVLTSPPYPGVYVLYHRWKVRSRRETPAPFWLADCLDGRGINHYTLSARNGDSLRLYFEKLRKAFAGIVSLMSADTWLVQAVGFSEGNAQFMQYLSLMSELGLEEITFPKLANSSDGRLWREVPGRRWWVLAGNRAGTAPHTAREVILIHRRR